MAAVTAGISLLPHLHLSDQAINSYTRAKAQKAPGCLNTEIALIYIQTGSSIKAASHLRRTWVVFSYTDVRCCYAASQLKFDDGAALITCVAVDCAAGVCVQSG